MAATASSHPTRATTGDRKPSGMCSRTGDNTTNGCITTSLTQIEHPLTGDPVPVSLAVQCAAALLAQTEEREVIHIHDEFLFALDLVEQRLHRLVANLLYLVAVAADEVVVRYVSGDLVNHVAADLRGDYQPHLAQEVQVAVHGRAVDVRRLGPHAPVNLVRRGVAIPRADGVQNQLALGRHPEAPFPHERRVIPPMMRHRPRRYCD